MHIPKIALKNVMCKTFVNVSKSKLFPEKDYKKRERKKERKKKKITASELKLN